MSLENLMEVMLDEMNEANGEMNKFVGGNKSAGTRARKSMQAIKEAAQNVRKHIQEIKNNS